MAAPSSYSLSLAASFYPIRLGSGGQFWLQKEAISVPPAMSIPASSQLLVCGQPHLPGHCLAAPASLPGQWPWGPEGYQAPILCPWQAASCPSLGTRRPSNEPQKSRCGLRARTQGRGQHPTPLSAIPIPSVAWWGTGRSFLRWTGRAGRPGLSDPYSCWMGVGVQAGHVSPAGHWGCCKLSEESLPGETMGQDGFSPRGPVSPAAAWCPAPGPASLSQPGFVGSPRWPHSVSSPTTPNPSTSPSPMFTATEVGSSGFSAAQESPPPCPCRWGWVSAAGCSVDTWVMAC